MCNGPTKICVIRMKWKEYRVQKDLRVEFLPASTVVRRDISPENAGRVRQIDKKITREKLVSSDLKVDEA